MNIFVGSLNYRMTDEDLQAVFEEYGEVSSARIIMDRDTNRSKGFGFVEMEDDAAAQNAIDELDGAEIEGRTIAVSVAKPRTERPARSFNNRGGGFRGERRDRY
ncbi:MAG: RNA recognition motif domain-containing protein [Bacteroides sp.]